MDSRESDEKEDRESEDSSSVSWWTAHCSTSQYNIVTLTRTQWELLCMLYSYILYYDDWHLLFFHIVLTACTCEIKDSLI